VREKNIKRKYLDGTKSEMSREKNKGEGGGGSAELELKER